MPCSPRGDRVLERITPLVLTFDEAANIERTLSALRWARRVVVLDSGSTDGTQAIVAKFPNAVLYTRPFDTQASQWNFGLRETGIDTEWILALDADYFVPPQFAAELEKLEPPSGVGGYRAAFEYCVDGQPLRCGLYPPVTVLFRRSGARYAQEGHTQRIQVAGSVEKLSSRLLHDDRKPLERWFRSQIGYMRQEAEHLLSTPLATLGVADRIRLWVLVAPALVFVYCLFVKGGLLDGRRGVFYAMQRAVAEIVLSAFLVEAMMDRGKKQR